MFGAVLRAAVTGTIRLVPVRRGLAALAVAALLPLSLPATRAMTQDGGPTGTPVVGAAAICGEVAAQTLATPGTEDDHDHDHDEAADRVDPGAVVLAPFDLVYVDAMIARDAGTATIGRLIADRASVPRVRDLGQALAAGGDANVAALSAWREQWYPDAPDVADLQLVQLVDEAEASSGAPADAGMGGGDPARPEDDLLTLCTTTDGFDAIALEIIATRIETDLALAGIAFGRAEHTELLGFARARGESGVAELARVEGLSVDVLAATPPG